MGGPARVRSIDALDDLAAAVAAFGAEAAVALDDLRMDLHRAMEWIAVDRKEHWTHELRASEHAVAEAKLNLERRRTFTVGDQKPSCREQEKALEAAKRKVALARQKLEAVKRWGRLLEHQSMECRSGVASLATWVETDVPRAISLLRRMGGALDSYVGRESSASTAPPATTSDEREEEQTPTAGEAASGGLGETGNSSLGETRPRELPSPENEEIS